MTLSTLSPRRLLAAAAATGLLALVLGGAPRGATAAEDLTTLEQARLELGRLKDGIEKRKTANEELIASIEAVAKAYTGGIQPIADLPADASPDQVKGHEAEKVKHETAVAGFRKEARKLLEKALTLEKPRGTKDDLTNEREDVNIKAFQAAGQTKDPSFADDVIRAIEVKLAKAKYTVSTGLWEAAFAALAALDHEDSTKKSIQWITENYTHGNSSPESAVEQLIAAHKSIPLYKKIPGKLRYDLVAEMIKTYSGKESQAEQSKNDPKNQAAKVFWDRIGTGTIKAVQYLARNPTDEQGQVIVTMKDFQNWFRDHDNLKKEPWVGDELGDQKAEEKKTEEKKGEEKPEEKKPEEKKPDEKKEG